MKTQARTQGKLTVSGFELVNEAGDVLAVTHYIPDLLQHNDEERKANAEYLALAWNCHEELAREVGFYLQDHNIAVHNGSGETCDRCLEIRQAISHA